MALDSIRRGSGFEFKFGEYEPGDPGHSPRSNVMDQRQYLDARHLSLAIYGDCECVWLFMRASAYSLIWVVPHLHRSFR